MEAVRWVPQKHPPQALTGHPKVLRPPAGGGVLGWDPPRAIPRVDFGAAWKIRAGGNGAIPNGTFSGLAGGRRKRKLSF